MFLSGLRLELMRAGVTFAATSGGLVLLRVSVATRRWGFVFNPFNKKNGWLSNTEQASH